MADIDINLKYTVLDYILTNMVYNPTVPLNDAKYDKFTFKSMYMDYKNHVIIETEYTESYIDNFEWDVIAFLYRQLKKFIRSTHGTDILKTQEIKQAEELFEF